METYVQVLRTPRYGRRNSVQIHSGLELKATVAVERSIFIARITPIANNKITLLITGLSSVENNPHFPSDFMVAINTF